jgi:hypothetical protein
MMTRGPDATLQRGSTMEMLLDRELRFQDDEIPASGSASRQNVPPPPQQGTTHSKPTGLPSPNRPAPNN